MKIVKSYLFIVLVGGLAFILLWDYLPYGFDALQIQAKFLGYAKMDHFELSNTILEDFVVPGFNKVGVSFDNFKEGAVDQILQVLESFKIAFDNFKSVIVEKFNILAESISRIFSIFGG